MSNQRKMCKPKSYRCAECAKGYTTPGGLTQHRTRGHELPIALRKMAEQQSQHLDITRVTTAQAQLPEPPPLSRSPSLEPRIPDAPGTTPPPNHVETHPIIDGTPCDSEGYDYDRPPQDLLQDRILEEICYPFLSPSEFRLADFLTGNIDELVSTI
ncbi:hypothetical protein CC1G_14837 [Coprinopsis cinerea okayama7|uniref:C2H2-type domain-containing protein n=1 Tax=Coprinopsis cinerea (strain Okayama-7 / 130 / ATCC MYA-4618 / FGSC 9003) TaxID=240176 RepID=D6RNI7_COPC7|nr:hypothetical protein CC1G_14837 [Coprinopsis cinerea okayama7\|eukprot:XP_002910858.1 hypothetical protein CC1G_14837 [Coprinopsis cinerea okayama7\